MEVSRKPQGRKSGSAQAEAENWRSIGGTLLLLLFVLLALGFQTLLFADDSGDVDLASDSGSLVQQAVTLTFFFASAFLALRRQNGLESTLRAFGPFMPIILFCIVSLFWSDVRDITIRRSLRLFLDTVSIVMICVATSNSKRAALVFACAPFLIILADTLAIFFKPNSFTDLGFAGVHGNKNAAGAAYFFCIGAFLYAIRTKIMGAFTPACWGGLFFTFYLLWITHCKTVLLCVMPALAVVASLGALRRATPFLRRRAVLLLFALLAMFGASLVTMGDDFRAAILDDPTLTGRTPVWNFVLSRFAASPVGGIGYGALWQTGEDMSSELKSHQVNWVMYEAHNGYLDVLAQVGVIGLILTALVVVRQWLDVIPEAMRWQRDRSERFLAFFGSYVLIGAVLYNLTESALLRTGHPFWGMPLALATCLKLSSHPAVLAREPRTAASPLVRRAAGNRSR